MKKLFARIHEWFQTERAERLERSMMRNQVKSVREIRRQMLNGEADTTDVEIASEQCYQAIAYYDNAVNLNSEKHYGVTGVFGRVAWVSVLAVVELSIWLGIMMLVRYWFNLDYSNNVVFWVAAIGAFLVAALPLDKLAITSTTSIFDPALKLRIARLRVWHDEMESYLA